MTAPDTDDLLVQALEPGEKIVWSDRPHRMSSAALHMLWRRLTTWTSLLSFVFLAFVVYVFMNVRDRIEAGELAGRSWEALGVPIVLGVAAVPILIETFRFLHGIARTPSHRYAATDKGRGIIVLPGIVGTFELPRPESITTRASGQDEHGDVELGVRDVVERGPGKNRKGLRQVVFRSVSYPLVAVDTLRAVAQGNRNC